MKGHISHSYAHRLNLYAASVCLTEWSPWLARDKAQIERVQRRAACYVHNTYSRYSSVTTMLQSLNWEPLQPRRVNICVCALMIIYKAYYNLAIFVRVLYTKNKILLHQSVILAQNDKNVCTFEYLN